MKIAIIGAGISGLCSANLLAKHGFEIDIFEKSRGLGGRLTTKRLDWAHIDIGAQYFTARDPRFIKQVEVWQSQQAAAVWNFEPLSVSDGKLLSSKDTTTRYVGTPRMNSIVHELSRDLTLKLATRINTIKLDSQSSGAQTWSLIDEAGKKYLNYDWLIVSAPAEQAQYMLEQSPSDLSSIAQQIPINAHRPCWAVALTTYGYVPEAIQGVFGDDVISWVSRQSAKPERPLLSGDDCWLLHFSDKWSSENSKNTTKDLKQIALDWLNNYLKPLREANADPLKAGDSYKHFWLYAKLNDEQTSLKPIVNEHNKLAVIGDWCFGGRVEGAYLSALDVVDFLSKK
jgi:predicted NAD/FAD-dependent oxidoreductase